MQTLIVSDFFHSKTSRRKFEEKKKRQCRKRNENVEHGTKEKRREKS